jgi:hypothetical protein
MVYDISTSKKGADSFWLSEAQGVKQMAAWLFRRKVQQAMKSRKSFPLENKCEIGTLQK